MTVIDNNILNIIASGTTQDNRYFLPQIQLDRKTYVKVNEILEIIGGKWNRKFKCHIFETSPEETIDDLILTGSIEKPKTYDYFPTPKELAEKIVALANVTDEDVVLEPSAGQGHLIESVTNKDRIHCVEFLESHVVILRQKGYSNVTWGDFLWVTPKPIYDKIIMNPPFGKQADIDHVKHAWDFLNDGGRLVSIMSNSFTFRTNKKSEDFKLFVQENGYVINNPAGSFKESGTMVNTVTVVLEK